jgi:hypothetical protein
MVAAKDRYAYLRSPVQIANVQNRHCSGKNFTSHITPDIQPAAWYDDALQHFNISSVVGHAFR